MVKEDIKSMIKISIIIPYHNESEDVIKPLLKSIKEQKKILISMILRFYL